MLHPFRPAARWRRLKTILGLVGFLLAASAGAAGAADGSLKILYFERPPYYTTAPDGQVGGLIGTRAAQVLAKAQITAIWKPASAKRHLKTIETNDEAICALGWFKTAEREKFAQFTAPIFRDAPMVAIGRADDHRVSAYTELPRLLSDPNLRLGRKLGYSYGGVIDQQIQTTKPRLVETSQDVDGMIRMLLAGRFDYFFTGVREAESQIDRLGIPRNLVQLRPLNGIPEGNDRYLICSHKVPLGTIERINRAIKSLRP